jgi:succinate-acetate transporter protein
MLTIFTAYFFIMMGILCFVYLICSIRTNLIFFMIFFTLVPAFGLLAGSYFQLANGNEALSDRLGEAAGAFAFVTCICGWYIFFAIMLASVDFPLDLPRKFPTYPWTLVSFTNELQSSISRI